MANLNTNIETTFAVNDATSQVIDKLVKEYEALERAGVESGKGVSEETREVIQSLTAQQSKVRELQEDYRQLAQSRDTIARSMDVMSKRTDVSDSFRQQYLDTQQRNLVGTESAMRNKAAEYREEGAAMGELTRKARERLEVERKTTQQGNEQVRTTRTLQQEYTRINDISGRMAATLAGVFSVRMAANFVKKVAETRGEFQKLEVAFETMLGTKAKSDKMMGEVMELALKTPFYVSDVAAGAKQLMAYGTSADTVVDTLRRLGDVAAGVSIPLSRMVGIYGRVQAQGKLTARTLLQFNTAGIPIIKTLTETMNKSEQEIQKMITAGKVGFPEVEKAIRRLTDEGGKFANLTEKQSKTITGQLAVIGGQLQIMFNDIGKKSEGGISKVLNMTQSLIENYEKVGKTMGAIIAAYGVERAAVMAYAIAQNTAAKATVKSTIANMGDIAAVRGMTAAQTQLNRALMANPYVMVTAALVGLTAGAIKYYQANSKAYKQQKTINDAYKESAAEMNKELTALAQMNGQLKALDKSSEKYAKVKREMIDKFSPYLKGIGEEIKSVGYLKGKYDELRGAVIDYYKAKGFNKALEDFTKDAQDTLAKTLWGDKKSLTKGFTEGFSKQLLNTEIENAFVKENQELVLKQSDGVLTKAEERRKKHLEKMFDIARKNEDNYLQFLNESGVKEADVEIKAKGKAAEAVSFFERALAEKRIGLQKKTTMEMQGMGATASLVPKYEYDFSFITEGAEDANAVQEDLKRFNTFYALLDDNAKAYLATAVEASTYMDEAKKALVDAFGKDYSDYSQGQDGGVTTPETEAPTTDNTKAKYELERKQIEAEIKAAEDLLKLRKKKNEALSETYSKEQEDRDIAHEQELLSIRRQMNEKLKAYQDLEKAEWKVTHPDAKEKEFIPKTAELKPEDVKYFADLVKAENDAYAAENAKAQREREKEIGNQRQKEIAINAEWQKKIDDEQDKLIKEHYRKQRDIELAESREAYQEQYGTREDYYKAVEERMNAQLELVDDSQREMAKKVNAYNLAVLKLGDVSDYGSFTAKVQATQEKFRAEGEKLGVGFVDGINRATVEAMSSLFDDLISSGAADEGVVKWAAKMSKAGVTALEKELFRLEGALKDMEVNGEGDADTIALLNAQMAKLKTLLNETTSETTKSEAKWTDLMEVIGDVGDAFTEVGDSIGGVAGEMITNTGNIIAGFQGMVVGIKAFDKSAKAAEKSTVILAVISAALKVINVITNIVKANKEALEAAEVANDKYTRSLEELGDARRREALTNAFGTDELKLFVTNLEIARKRLSDISRDGGVFTADMRSNFQKLLNSNKGLVKSFDPWQNGQFDGDALREWYEAYGDGIDDASKRTIENMLNDWDAYKDAMASVGDFLNNLFGDVANNVADKMVQSFIDTGDALSDLTEIANGFGKTMATSVIKGMLLDKVFTKQAQEAMQDMIAAGDTQGAIDKYNQLLEQSNELTTQANEFLRGLDTSSWGDTIDQVSSKGIATASQESVDENNGRLTMIQSHTFEMNENVKAIRTQNEALIANSSSLLSEVMGIHRDTRSMNLHLDGIGRKVDAMNDNLEFMMVHGIRMN